MEVSHMADKETCDGEVSTRESKEAHGSREELRTEVERRKGNMVLCRAIQKNGQSCKMAWPWCRLLLR